jgi:hypothetical protein
MTENTTFISLEEALRQNKISAVTYEKVKIAKSIIENKYKMKRIEEIDKKRGEFHLIQIGI